MFYKVIGIMCIRILFINCAGIRDAIKNTQVSRKKTKNVLVNIDLKENILHNIRFSKSDKRNKRYTIGTML